ncbi:Epidermal stripes and patches [Carabus blaptoides fortunei]
MPILQWLPKYDGQTALADFIAGITVGLTLIPQSIAYAALANLSPQYGLYSSLSGGLVYMLFGTIPEINIAPTALLSLLTHNYTYGTHPAFAVLLCFLAGCVELLFGLMNLGFLVEFVSVPVVAGFTSAAALIIASAQVKNLLGLKFNAEGFLDIWTNIISKIGQIKKWDAILSLCCCLLLLSLRQLKDIRTPTSDNKEKGKSTIRKILWFICVARNAIVVICCAVVAYIFDQYKMKPFSLTDKVASGLPQISAPSFHVYYNNHTATFAEITSHLGSGIIVVPLVAIIGNVAIAKAFSHGKTVNASQEMFTLGLCNIIGSFFSSMPVNGSFSRSAVNNASGVKTPFGGLYTGLLVILALSFLTPYFSFIPKATLSSVIICAVIFMVEVSIVLPIWRINKINLIPFLATFFACLFLGVELGILVGIAIDLLFMLYYSARPQMQVEAISIQNEEGLNFSTLKPEGAVLFPAVEHMRRAISKASESSKVIVIDCVYVTRVDYTTGKGINDAVSDIKKTGKEVVFMRVKPEISQILGDFCKDKCTFLQTEEELDKYLSEKCNKPAANPSQNEGTHINNIDISQNDTNCEPAVSITLKPQESDISSTDNIYKATAKRIQRRWTQAEIILPSYRYTTKEFMTRL